MNIKSISGRCVRIFRLQICSQMSLNTLRLYAVLGRLAIVLSTCFISSTGCLSISPASAPHFQQDPHTTQYHTTLISITGDSARSVEFPCQYTPTNCFLKLMIHLTYTTFSRNTERIYRITVSMRHSGATIMLCIFYCPHTQFESRLTHRLSQVLPSSRSL
jgi:hypothetical protein